MELNPESRVKIEKRAIFVDGKAVQIASGAIHYFRVPREYWRDRMEKAAQMGLNCIETYMSWNLHERKEGQYDFSEMLDFEAFVRTAAELGLYVIMRPGPYICAEWDNGGLPSWLVTKPGIRFRRMNKPYIEAFDRYFGQILPKIKALQYDEGGPIIALQIENEYGSYSCDKAYLTHIRDLYRAAGITIPLFTADGPSDIMVGGGALDGVPMFLNFGSRACQVIDFGKKRRPDDPFFCTEFWCGWFDSWGQPRHKRSADQVAEETDDILAAGGSINYYMFHGGTNFQLTAGANGTDDTPYTPDVTNYDYDAPLSEDGSTTEKYFAVQEVLKRYFPDRPYAKPAPVRHLAPRKLGITAMAPLFENLERIGACTRSVSPMTMEELGQDFGYVYYRTRVDLFREGQVNLRKVRDRAIVYLDDEAIFTYYRNDKEAISPSVRIPEGGADLSLLVENMGRINYGHLTGFDRKGIVEDVAFSYNTLVNWENWTLDFDNPDRGQLDFKPFDTVLRGKPAYYLVEFDVDDPADTFLEFPGEHGCAWINGRAIGRYWSIGPGTTLYIPGPWLKKGRNRLVIFEAEALRKPYVRLVDQGCYGAPEHRE